MHTRYTRVPGIFRLNITTNFQHNTWKYILVCILSFLTYTSTINNAYYMILFERSEFLIATSKKKKMCVCACVRLILVFVGNALCTRYVSATLYDTTYVLCTRYVWYQVRIMYQIRMYHTCRCTINSTAVSLFVYSLVGGGTHDTYVPPKKQLYRYLFLR